MKSNKLRLLWCSDQHVGHTRTPAKHILANLSRFFYMDNDLDKVDMVIMGGDFLDRLLESTSTDWLAALRWMRKFLAICHQKGVKVRFLEGTSSHDWAQPQHFELVGPEGQDIKYADTLSIETFPDLDNFTMMYVPDNMGQKSPDEIWELALQVLNQHGLKQVDLIAFHGAFYYQLPEKARKHAHMEERWETIVKYGIFAGHVHIPSQKGKIYCSGSFDRIRHGEEHPKGGYVIELDLKTGEFNPVFYENKRALPYLTMRIDTSVTAEELVPRIHQFIENHKLPPNSQLKIRGGQASIVNPVMQVITAEYPEFGFAVENETEGEVLLDETMFDPHLYKGITLTKDNLFDSLWEKTQEKFGSLSLSREEVEKVFKEFQ